MAFHIFHPVYMGAGFSTVFHIFHPVHMGAGVSTVFHFFHLVHMCVCGVSTVGWKICGKTRIWWKRWKGWKR